MTKRFGDHLRIVSLFPSGYSGIYFRDSSKVVSDVEKEYIEKEELLNLIDKLEQSEWYNSGNAPYERNLRADAFSMIKKFCIDKCVSVHL